jgi:hypothetical protein
MYLFIYSTSRISFEKNGVSLGVAITSSQLAVLGIAINIFCRSMHSLLKKCIHLVTFNMCIVVLNSYFLLIIV